MLYSSAALQMSTWSRARLICSSGVSLKFVLPTIRDVDHLVTPPPPPPIQQRQENIPVAIHLLSSEFRTYLLQIELIITSN